MFVRRGNKTKGYTPKYPKKHSKTKKKPVE